VLCIALAKPPGAQAMLCHLLVPRMDGAVHAPYCAVWICSRSLSHVGLVFTLWTIMVPWQDRHCCSYHLPLQHAGSRVAVCVEWLYGLARHILDWARCLCCLFSTPVQAWGANCVRVTPSSGCQYTPHHYAAVGTRMHNTVCEIGLLLDGFSDPKAIPFVL
jgi:hypothetical protein